jgi:hypothetical protein
VSSSDGLICTLVIANSQVIQRKLIFQILCGDVIDFFIGRKDSISLDSREKRDDRLDELETLLLTGESLRHRAVPQSLNFMKMRRKTLLVDFFHRINTTLTRSFPRRDDGIVPNRLFVSLRIQHPSTTTNEPLKTISFMISSSILYQTHSYAHK